MREALAAADRYLALDRTGLDPSTRLDGDIGATEILRFCGEAARARPLEENSLRLARQFPEAQVMGGSSTARTLQMSQLTDLSDLELRTGDTRAARRHATEALQLRRADGRPMGIAQALNGMLNIDLAEGRYEAAATHAREAADLVEAAGSPETHYYRTGQAEAELLCGRHGDAARLLREHPPLPPPQDDVYEGFYWLTVAFQVIAAHERHSEAVALADAAYALRAETGIVMAPWEEERFNRVRSNSQAQRAKAAQGATAGALTPSEAIELALTVLSDVEA